MFRLTNSKDICGLNLCQEWAHDQKHKINTYEWQIGDREPVWAKDDYACHEIIQSCRWVTVYGLVYKGPKLCILNILNCWPHSHQFKFSLGFPWCLQANVQIGVILLWVEIGMLKHSNDPFQLCSSSPAGYTLNFSMYLYVLGMYRKHTSMYKEHSYCTSSMYIQLLVCIYNLFLENLRVIMMNPV